MIFEKSKWTADETNVSLSLSISKIDRERRLVSGFATLDNIDTSDDVVTADASAMAFNEFRGNVREMHEPIAAGRVVDFNEETFYDSNTESFYRGIFVTAYVSLGAEDTWQKVLDGTLSGFSIGGKILEANTEYVPDLGKAIRYITKYELIELSLVDNPANQLANVFSIVKSKDGSVMKGMVKDTHIINVFWCPVDKMAKNSSEESETCFVCNGEMKQIDWFEKGEDEAYKTASAVSHFLQNGREKSNTSEGGVEMPEEIVKSENAEETEVVATEEVTDEQPENEETVEEAVVEVETEPDFEKMFDNLRDSVHESLETSKKTVEKAVESVEQKVADVTKAFDEKASEFEKTLGELSDRLEAIRSEREDVAKRLDALEKASAIKKSGEVEEVTTPVKKARGGIWAGTILGDD